MAFADLKDCIDLAEDYIKYCVKCALEMCAEDLEFIQSFQGGERELKQRLKSVLDHPFKVCSLIAN